MIDPMRNSVRRCRWLCPLALMVAACRGTVPPPDCVTATAGGAWQTRSYPLQEGAFSVEFDATPSASDIDAVIGLSTLPPVEYRALAVVVRFNPDGRIDARNGAVYEAIGAIPYTAGVRYHFRMRVDVKANRYSVFVTLAGGSERPVGVDFSFRHEQEGVSRIQHWGTFTKDGHGSLQVCGFTVS
jgi:hypothetical protein